MKVTRRWAVLVIATFAWSSAPLAGGTAVGKGNQNFCLLTSAGGLPQSKPAAPSARDKKSAKAPAEVIDINRASAVEFAKLPGIGPKLAGSIVAFRQEHGPFRRVEDLMGVRGLGLKKWKTIRPFIRVGTTGKTRDER